MIAYLIRIFYEHVPAIAHYIRVVKTNKTLLFVAMINQYSDGFPAKERYCIALKIGGMSIQVYV